MENKKSLKISAAVCDVHAVSEETLAAYEQVSIGCTTLITSPEAQALLGRYGARIDTAQVMNMEGDVRLSSVNGSMQLMPGQAVPAEKTFLMVNGVLDIAPGSKETLRAYAGMTVNGSITVPESMTGLLGGININGVIQTYPDGAIRLKGTTVLDRTFPLRAKQDALYHAANRVIALAGDIDFARLAEKNVRFSTKKLIVAESLVEAALPLFDEKADIQVLPDGCAYLDDDTTLDGNTVRRHGGKLYIDGDLLLLEDGPWLDQVTYLRVDGDVLVRRDLEERLHALDAEYEELYSVGGTLLMGKAHVRVGRALLEGAERGLSVVSCSTVEVDGDVPAQLLREKLVSVAACASVICTEEQRAVIEPMARDVASIGPAQSEDEAEEKDTDEVKVSAVFYTL